MRNLDIISRELFDTLDEGSGTGAGGGIREGGDVVLEGRGVPLRGGDLGEGAEGVGELVFGGVVVVSYGTVLD